MLGRVEAALAAAATGQVSARSPHVEPLRSVPDDLTSMRNVGSMSRIAVLVIDDSVTIRASMEQILLKDPMFEVAGIASSAIEARRMMRTVFHDVVTLDLFMPETGGLEFLDELLDKPHAPIVVVSSSTRTGSLEEVEAIDRGAFSCFDKAKIMSDAAGFLRALIRASAAKDAEASGTQRRPARLRDE